MVLHVHPELEVVRFTRDDAGAKLAASVDVDSHRGRADVVHHVEAEPAVIDAVLHTFAASAPWRARRPARCGSASPTRQRSPSARTRNPRTATPPTSSHGPASANTHTHTHTHTHTYIYIYIYIYGEKKLVTKVVNPCMVALGASLRRGGLRCGEGCR
jgi:hypothetical protein